MDTEIITSPENRTSIVICGLISLAFILYGAYCFFNAGIMEKHCTSTAEGTVIYAVKNYDKGGYNNSSDWAVSFTADDSREYTFEVKRASHAAKTGDHYTVWYDPAKPRRAYVKEAPPDNGFAWVCAGIFLAVVWYIVMFLQKNGRRLFLDR